MFSPSYLMNSLVCDIDEQHGPDLDHIRSISDGKGHGLIVTNLFGHIVDIDKYLQFCQERQWPCIFDNACTSFTYYKGKNSLNYGDGSIVSLHHTKPIGFGEGGLIILKKEYELVTRKLINFGFGERWHSHGNNAKMSDIAAAFIHDYNSRNFEKIIETNRHLYTIFKNNIISEFRLLSDHADDTPFTNCLPLIASFEINHKHLDVLEQSGISAKKYYRPLTNLKKSAHLFEHILCLPLNCDMTEADIQRFIIALKKIIKY